MADEYRPIHGAGRQTFGLHGLWGELSAEFLGTMTLIMFGDGVVAMAVAALPGSGRAATPTTIFMASGDWLLITLGWAFAVMFGVYVAGGISGAHINPAVTLGLALRRRFPWSSVVPYWIAQVVGAFLGAAMVMWVYHDAISAYNAAAHLVPSAGNALATYSIFATFPAAYFHGTIGGPFLDEAVGTATRRRPATSGRSSSASSSSRSAPRSEPTPGTRSTPPVTSGRASSPSSQATVRLPCPGPSTTVPASRSATTSGYRSSVLSSAAA
jgi:hypothetical protein